MKPYQRVANKHMARTSPKHNLTFNTSWEFSSKLISVATEGGLEQARIEAWIEGAALKGEGAWSRIVHSRDRSLDDGVLRVGLICTCRSSLITE